MNKFFSAFIGAASLCCPLSFHLTTKHIEVMNEFNDWFFNRAGLNISTYLIMITIALIYKSAGRPGSKPHQLVTKWGDSIVNFYASTTGAATGWIVGFCIAAAITKPEQYLLISIFLSLLALNIFFSPLVMAIEARRTIERVNENTFRKDWKAFLARRAGDILLVIVPIGMIHDTFFSK